MNVLITAGDPSADLYAARLMEAVRRRVPDVRFEGFGGPAMEMQGLRSIARLNDLAVTGFWEVAKRIQYFRGLMDKCEKLITQRKPALFIPIDYPGFNLRLAARARKANVPVAWYIAPQLWAWGKNRAKELAEVVNTLMVVFPFEEEFFKQYGIRTAYVGHPLIEQLSGEQLSGEQLSGEPQLSSEQRVASRDSHGTWNLEPGTRGGTWQMVPGTVLLMPGSRVQELSHHIPLLAQVVSNYPDKTQSFVVAKSRAVSENDLRQLTDLGVQLESDSHLAMQNSRAGLIKAGTSTLEAAIIGLPFATFYKTSWLTYHLARRLINVQSVTMMNLLLHKNVVNEYIQHNATVKGLVTELDSLMNNESRRTELADASEEVRRLLGGSGASERAADVIASLI